MSDMLLKAFDNEDNVELPELHVGDNVTIHLRINVGERNERVQVVRGVVIRLAVRPLPIGFFVLPRKPEQGDGNRNEEQDADDGDKPENPIRLI